MRTRALLAACALAGSLDAQATKDCAFTDSGTTPLPDLRAEYRGAEGGLYLPGTNFHPADHLARGIDLATREVQPLDASGAPDPLNGRIVLISVGMSNTTQEFSAFVSRADSDPARNPRLVIVDGAQGGQDARRWLDPAAATWATVDARLAQRGVTPLQVQVAWVKQALAGPGTQDPLEHARDLQAMLATIARNLKVRYPGIKLAYFSSRTRAYRHDVSLNPEPYAYASCFSVRGLISDQAAGAPDLGRDAAPWLSWGPYLWADGPNPRSDGFTWLCEDTANDGTHPSASGRRKVAELLLAFFKTDPSATPWFLKPPGAGPPEIAGLTASPASGPAPLLVNLAASAADPGGAITEHVFGYGDGTFSFPGSAAAKTFSRPGLHVVRLTVIDGAGNAAQRTIEVAVTSGSAPAFVRGDANGDQALDISDGVAALVFLFGGDLTPPCLDAADADDSGVVEVTDAVLIVEHLFRGGPDLPAPYPDPGADPTEDSLGGACR